MKGDANIDFIISITIFLGFLVYLLTSMNQLVITGPPRTGIIESNEYLSSSLVMNSLEYKNKTNILDSDKLDNINCTDLGKILNASVYVEVKSRIKDWACKKEPNKSLPHIERPVYVRLKNGIESPGILRVWVWKGVI